MFIFASNIYTMKTIRDFNELRDRLKTCGCKVRVAAVEGTDDHSQEAIQKATHEGWAEVANIHLESIEQSAREAVRMVRNGEADVIMKGIINSDILLRAIINKEEGILPKGNILSHVSVMQIPTYHKLLFMSDAAVIPYPTLEQRRAIIGYTKEVCCVYGISQPRIALIHCNEKVSEKFPLTTDYAQLRQEDFSPAIVDGPMDVKCAVNREAALLKHIDSPIDGDADVLIMPDIEAANVYYKTLTSFTDTRLAVGLVGAACPVSLTSRGDSADTKYNSLAMACLTIIKNLEVRSK